MKKLFLLLLATLVTACAAPGPLYEPPPSPPPGYATVVFMREPGLAGAAWPHSYYIDKKLVAKLAVHGYTFVHARPGRREIHSGATPEYRGHLFTVDLAAGQTYYYKEGRSIGGIVPVAGVVTVSQVDSALMLNREQAEKELKTYGYQDPEIKSVD